MTLFVGETPSVRKIQDMILRIAPTDATALLTGESGTGKEVLARLLHENSPRRNGPFVAVNLAAIPDTLIESELFGHERGAFTGADRRRIGRFEAAENGTILLDEIGALRKDLQAKLLRVLQEKTVERLGGTSPIPVNARILAATNEDLARAVEEGRFLEALFYRVHVVPIHLPPLRERRADIPLLAAHFFGILARQYGREAPDVAPEAMKILAANDWPGNIRELENICERILVLLPLGENVTPEALPERLREGPKNGPAPGGPSRGDAGGGVTDLRSLDVIEREAIRATLEATSRNLSRAARILGVTRKTLRDKAKRHGLYPFSGSAGEPE